jgi:methionyl-tRNA formyltransferase
MSGKYLLERVIELGCNIDCIITLSPEEAIKKKVSNYFDFREIAERNNIRLYYPKSYGLEAEEDLEFFQKEKPDLLLVFGWQRIVPEEILKTLSIGALGAHGSSEELPKGRGRSPLNWSLIEGKKRFIMHLFYLSKGVDSGAVIDKLEFEINEFDTVKTLHDKAVVSIARLLEKNLKKILEGRAVGVPQKGEPTYYPKRTPEMGKIEWEKSNLEIYDFVRALTKPYPGAFTFLDEKKIMVWKAQPFDSKLHYYKAKAGEIVEVFPDGAFVVKTGKGSLLVTDYSEEPSDEKMFGPHPEILTGDKVREIIKKGKVLEDKG